MTTLFISDLHLSAERPQITALFQDFLAGEAKTAEALYILGDLFEYWIGDDSLKLPGNEHAGAVAALKSLTRSGVPVYVQHGNRDFLLGEDFCAHTGCRLLDDPAVIALYGTPTLLMHGDLLCTDDTEYQAVRKRIRDPRFVQAFLLKPADEREAVVRDYRVQSKAITSQKAPEIMDVNLDAVAATMRAHRVRHLIHGHTHRPAQHRFKLGDEAAERIVLGDWYEQGSVLRCTPQAWTLQILSPRK